MYESIRAGQTPLFIESMEEAVSSLAAAIGGKKKLAVLLRPDIDDETTAHKWLIEVLSANPDRRVVFHAAHLIRACRIARDHNVHFLKHWFDEATGYKPSEIASAKTPEQEMAARGQALVRAFQNWADEAAAMNDNHVTEMRTKVSRI